MSATGFQHLKCGMYRSWGECLIQLGKAAILVAAFYGAIVLILIFMEGWQ